MTKILSDNLPIGIVITLIVQTSALFYWGGGVQEKIINLSDSVDKHEKEDKEFQTNMASINGRLVRIETLLKQQNND